MSSMQQILNLFVLVVHVSGCHHALYLLQLHKHHDNKSFNGLLPALSLLQAWSTSAHNCLPAFFPSCNMSSEKLHGKPAGWDWLHYLLTGSLTVVSAALGYYIMRERVLARKLMSSNAELSKLLFKVST